MSFQLPMHQITLKKIKAKRDIENYNNINRGSKLNQTVDISGEVSH